jgi:hypothetical protein
MVGCWGAAECAGGTRNGTYLHRCWRPWQCACACACACARARARARACLHPRSLHAPALDVDVGSRARRRKQCTGHLMPVLGCALRTPCSTALPPHPHPHDNCPEFSMSTPLLDVWEAAASSPYQPSISKDAQFTLGASLLLIGTWGCRSLRGAAVANSRQRCSS